MDPFKILGAILIALGFMFRAISIAYFEIREKKVPDTAQDRKRFEARKKRALLLDSGFIVFGFYILLTH